MVSKRFYCPHWSWWLRSGERISLGLDIRKVLDFDSHGISQTDRAGLADCLKAVEQGMNVVDSMSGSGVNLPPEAWCLLDAGERTGRLGEAMGEVGTFLKEQKQRRRELVGQLWYPAVVMLTGFVVMGIILVWVVPQMKEISKSMGQGGEMPWLTEHIGTLYGLLFVSAVSLSCLLLAVSKLIFYLSRTSLKWARIREKLLSRIPLVSTLRRSRREARILRQIGTLIRGGITLPSALQSAASRSPEQFEAYQLDQFRKRLLMGIAFQDSLIACHIISRSSQPLLLTGQESGRLDSYAIRIASDLDQEVIWKIRQIIQVVEPVTIIGLSFLVAGLVLAYLLPTISMLEQLA